DPDKDGISLEVSCDRASLGGRIETCPMVSLGHREADPREQRPASNGVVATMTVKEGTDPVGAFAYGSRSPVLSQPGRHRQTEIRAVRIGQTMPQRGADVVRFAIQLVEGCQPGQVSGLGEIGFDEPTKTRIERQVGAP